MGSGKRRLKQIFIPYWEWEDWINGMWVRGNDEQLQPAIDFTADWVVYGNAMGEVIQAWPRTMLNSMTNLSINRRAFLGHCAVTFKLGIPESTTRKAWGLLTNEQRFNADEIAEKHIKHWEHEHKRKNISLHKGMGRQMLFEWPT